MRRFAGAFVRRKRIEVLLLMAAGGGVLVGLWLGYLLHQAMGAWLDGVWVSVGFGGAILVAVAAFWVVFRKLERGRLGRLEKGEDAEVRAGQFIEHALTAPDCAVAHSVTGIARIGDIDHLVATPVRLWVIETKYRRVPREHFQEVLRRIADNTTAVRKWAAPGTPVRGCLVLAYESRIHRKMYDYGKEAIVVHTPASLARELQAEAKRKRVLDEEVAAQVWNLGRNAG